MFIKKLLPVLLSGLLMTNHSLAADTHEVPPTEGLTNDAHQHDADIQPYKVGNQLLTNNTLFEANFGDLAGGQFGTSSPGFDVDTVKGKLGAGNWLRFRPIGQLQFWNGNAWVNDVPNQERIEIKDALGNVTTLSASGFNNNGGVIAEIDAAGDVHEHVDFAIKDASNVQAGAVGAYRIQLSLYEAPANTTTALAETAQAITIIFNRGLSTAEYEKAVSAAGGQHDNAEYDATTGILTIHDVEFQNQHFFVTLQLLNNLFGVQTVKAATEHHAQSAQFNGTQLSIPSVRAFNKDYQAVLRDIGNLQFKLDSISELPEHTH